MCLAVPDTCNTPAGPAMVPVPYPNLGDVSTVKKTVPEVLNQNKESAVVGSELPSSNGDEAGTGGGIMSGTKGDKVTFKSGSSKVRFAGKQAAMLTSTTGQNGTSANAPAGAQIAPSQTKVFVAP
jgi:hypothetical protein